MDFGLEIQNERKIILRFTEFPTAAHDRLLTALEKLEARLEAAVLAEEPARTGALRANTGGKVFDDKDKISAKVTANLNKDGNAARKAAALEYGSRGVAITVKAHEERLNHLWSKKVSERMRTIATHSRIPTLTAQRFLRGPIDAMRGEAIAEMQAALTAATEDVS